MRNIGYISVILLIISFFSACGNSIPFDKKEWNNPTLREDEVTYMISEKRYGMTLWLKKNYIFCNKQVDEIIDKFIENPTEQIRNNIKKCIRDESKMTFLIREKNLTMFIGFANRVETDWLEIYFNKNDYVSKACIVHVDPYDKKRTEKIICGK